MPKLKGVTLAHDGESSLYHCEVPLGKMILKVTLNYIDTDQNLKAMMAVAEDVIDDWNNIFGRAVEPAKELLLDLGYEWAADCRSKDFISPTLYINDDPDDPVFSLLLNLPKLEGHYYVDCPYYSLLAVPEKDDIDLVSRY